MDQTRVHLICIKCVGQRVESTGEVSLLYMYFAKYGPKPKCDGKTYRQTDKGNTINVTSTYVGGTLKWHSLLNYHLKQQVILTHATKSILFGGMGSFKVFMTYKSSPALNMKSFITMNYV